MTEDLEKTDQPHPREEVSPGSTGLPVDFRLPASMRARANPLKQTQRDRQTQTSKQTDRQTYPIASLSLENPD